MVIQDPIKFIQEQNNWEDPLFKKVEVSAKVTSFDYIKQQASIAFALDALLHLFSWMSKKKQNLCAYPELQRIFRLSQEIWCTKVVYRFMGKGELVK